MIKKLILIIAFHLLVLFINRCHSQFTDISDSLFNLGVFATNHQNSYGSGVSFYDFNYDGWDDLSVGGGYDDPVFLINNEGVLEIVNFNIPNLGTGHIQTMLWVDFDNDGDADLFITKKDGNIELWQNDGAFNFTNIVEQAGLDTGIYRWSNAAFGDYDHDGCLDLYVTKYYFAGFTTDEEFASILYKNNCDGTFSNATVAAGVFLDPIRALQPLWVDVDNDGWEDLFIAIDRSTQSNELFINNQDGTFTRVTEDSGIDNFIDAMSASPADYNQDGYTDLYVTNNQGAPGNSLFKNNGDGTFTDVAIELGLNINIFSWAGLWIDYDNNTWDDILVCIMDCVNPCVEPGINHFYINDNGETFTEVGATIGLNEVNTNTFTTAKGDLNNDGYYDIVTNNISPAFQRLFLNHGGDNNYISISLQGTLANRDAIGSKIHCYFGDKHLVQQTYCGMNLSGQNSKKNIFGLGQYTQVDSVVIEWNSGTREMYQLPEINTRYHYIEGASLSLPFSVSMSGNQLMCMGDSVVLNAGEFESYLWSTGATEQEITVFEPGTYWVSVTNQFGLTVESLPVIIQWAPESEVDMQVNDISCFGETDGSIAVYIDGGQSPISISWNTGATTAVLENLDAGIYSFIGTNALGCQFNGSASVQSPFPMSTTYVTGDVLCFGENTGFVDLTVIGGTAPYSFSWGELNPEALFAGAYNVIVMDMNLCLTEVIFEIEEPLSLSIELSYTNAVEPDNLGSANIELLGGTPPYFIEWSTGEIDVYQISSLIAGEYWVNVSDVNDCIIAQNFSISDVTGIESTDVQHYKVYPNPFSSNIVIENVIGNNISFQLFNTNGKLIQQASKVVSPFQIALPELTNGIYFLNISDDVSIQQFKLVKID